MPRVVNYAKRGESPGDLPTEWHISSMTSAEKEALILKSFQGSGPFLNKLLSAVAVAHALHWDEVRTPRVRLRERISGFWGSLRRKKRESSAVLPSKTAYDGAEEAQ